MEVIHIHTTVEIVVAEQHLQVHRKMQEHIVTKQHLQEQVTIIVVQVDAQH